MLFPIVVLDEFLRSGLQDLVHFLVIHEVPSLLFPAAFCLGLLFKLVVSNVFETRKAWFLKRFFRDQPNPRPAMSDKCTLCGECVENCPVDAIEAGESALVFDYAKCIRCYCCDELCPNNGIKTERPFLGRLIWG